MENITAVGISIVVVIFGILLFTPLGGIILAYPNLVAILALVVSVVTIVIGVCGYFLQREQWLLSVKPHGNIEIHEEPWKLSIVICSTGLGPIKIKSMETVNKQGIKKNHPYDWIQAALDSQEKDLTTRGIFKSFSEGDYIKAGMDEVIVNFDFVSNTRSDEATKKGEVMWLRNVLKDLTIRIKYTDMYNRENLEIVYPLNGFGAT